MAKKPKTKMSVSERAKQFLPFSPLKGFAEALAEKEKIRVPRRELSEDMERKLNDALNTIRPGEMITAVYYHEEEYVQLTGMVAALDLQERILQIVMEKIKFDDLYEIIRIEE